MMFGTLEEYHKINLETEVEDANSHKLIDLLLRGAILKINDSIRYLEDQNYAEKGENISRAMDIVGVLEGCLDHKVGGELSQNLSKLYHYIIKRLFEANLHNDPKILTEAKSLLETLRSGWQGIENIKEVRDK